MADIRNSKVFKELQKLGDDEVQIFWILMQKFMPENISECGIRFAWPEYNFIRNDPSWITSLTGHANYRAAQNVLFITLKLKIWDDDGCGRLTPFKWLEKYSNVHREVEYLSKTEKLAGFKEKRG